jgi:cysteine-rich repeat protein
MAIVWLICTISISSGCVGSKLLDNDEVICPTGQLPQGERCALPQDIATCADKAPGELCTTFAMTDGWCVGGICGAIECGNDIIDPGEVCDDGGRLDLIPGTDMFDRCSANCKSNQTCGNGQVDLNPNPMLSEECDPDQVPGLSHDGCSSTCKRESLNWTLLRGEPSGRRNHAMAYRRNANKIIVFGGDTSDSSGSETWEYDIAAEQWQLMHPVHSPSLRTGHSMVDTIDGIVLFGGQAAGQLFNDTWRWDGSDWVQVTTTGTPPSPRAFFGMTYNEKKNVTVLFGGTANDASVWELSARYDWSQNTVSVGPSARDHHSQAYDRQSEKTIVFGGVSDGSLQQDTWQWDTASATQPGSWTKLNLQQTPGARWSATMAYAGVGADEKVVLFGGVGENGVLSDTWELSSGQWKNTTPAASPTPRYGATSIFAPSTGKMFLLGGFNTKVQSDFWNYSAGKWALSNNTKPAARAYMQGAYSPTARSLLMFGGYAQADTWEWQANTWRDGKCTYPSTVCPILPASRVNAMLVFDSSNQRYLMFGGAIAGSGFTDEMWTYRSETPNTPITPDWKKLTLATPLVTPPKRNAMSAFYDPRRNRVVMFGGVNAEGTFQDTWEFDCATDTWEQVPIVGPPASHGGVMVYDPRLNRGVLIAGESTQTWVYTAREVNGSMERKWSQLANVGEVPGARRYASAVYDPNRGLVVLLGGLAFGEAQSDIWELSNDTWRQVSLASGARPPRFGAIAAYDIEAARIVLFGGQNIYALDDTWTLQWASERVQSCPETSAAGAVDTDGDGLDSICDPDCWWRRDSLSPTPSAAKPAECL